MKKTKGITLIMIISAVLFSGCFNENKTDKGIGVKLLRNGTNVEVLSEGKYLGEEIAIEGVISENDITPKDGVAIIVKNNGNKTLVGAVKIGKEINAGETLFFISSKNYIEASLSDSADNNKIETVKKESSRATGVNILLGDFNGDKKVDMLDFAGFKAAYGVVPPSKNDLFLYDIAPAQKGTDSAWSSIYSQKSSDGKINIVDFVVFAMNYLKEAPVDIIPVSINVSGNSTLNITETSNFTATTTYSDNTTDTTGITWTSSDASVATVNTNGVVTGLKAGTTTVTAAKGTVTKSVTITVKEIIKTVTSVSVSGTTTVEIGKNITLTPAVTYSDNTTDGAGVTWINSDATVATIDTNGVITGIKTGKTNVTASAGGKTSTVKEITVTTGNVFNGIKVHFKKPTAWTGVYIYYWLTTGATVANWASCPVMTDEGNGWYSYIIDGATATSLLFKDNTGTPVNKTGDQTAIKSGEHWFDGAIWTDADPTDAIPPTVSLKKPIANANLTGKVEIAADAADNNAVDKVDFYYETKLIGTAKASPYSIVWDSAYSLNGTGKLTAVAFDKAGNATTSTPINVTLTNANLPPVAVAVDNLVALAGMEVEFDASGSYDNGQIVSYVWDNGLTGVKAKKVYPAVGNFTVKLTVTDDGGLTSQTSITVKVVDKLEHRDFREETVYFMMTDRFADGNTTNNNIYGDEYLPGGAAQMYTYDEDKSGPLSYYHGGDFDGIIKNLDYIKDMGFTAVWITPVVKQPEGRRINAGGTYSASAFHGYWAYDFDKIDAHLHSSGKDSDGWADFDKLVAAMHAKGMKLMLDIVVNHGHPADSIKGSTSKWADKWNKVIMDGTTWTYDKASDPLVDTLNVQTGFFSYAGTGNTWLIDLIDFNGNGPASNNAMPHLKNVYKRFIDHGVDAFRIDTVAYMSKANWADFTDEMYNYAKSKGNDYFYMIGEAWTGDRAGSNNAMDLIYGGKHFNMLDLHNASMDFPGWLGNVFKGDRGFEDQNVQKIFGTLGDQSGIYDPTYLGTFVDNHDVFRANGILNEAQYKNNLNYIFLFRGVPIVQYGTEAMYAWSKVPVTTNKEDVCARWMLGDEGINYVKTNKPTMYKHIKMLNALRRESEVLRKGQQTNIALTGTKAVIKREYNSSTLYVGLSIGAAFTQTLTGISDGTYTKFTPDSINGTYTKTTITVSGGTTTLDVPANSFVMIQK